MRDIQFEIQNNEFVKLLLESIGDGIFVLDLHGRQIVLEDLSIEIGIPDRLPLLIKDQKEADIRVKAPLKSSLTKEKLIDILQESNWNKAEVARRVGLSRASIWKYMKKWDIPLQPSK